MDETTPILSSGHERHSRSNHTYSLASKIVGNVLSRKNNRLIVRGEENIPDSGPYIVMVTHHTSIWDPLIIGRVLHDHNKTVLDFVGQAERMNKNRAVGYTYRKLGAFGMNPNTIDTAAIVEARHRLQAGRVVGVAPEAGIVKDHDLADISGAAGLFQMMTGAKTLFAGIAAEVDRSGKIPRVIDPVIHFSRLFEAPEASARFADLTVLERESDEGRAIYRDVMGASKDFTNRVIVPELGKVYYGAWEDWNSRHPNHQ